MGQSQSVLDKIKIYKTDWNTKSISKVGLEKSILKPICKKGFILVILWIEADGTKLIPMLVFKDQPDGRVKRRLNTNIEN